jgi:hypothetical protein
MNATVGQQPILLLLICALTPAGFNLIYGRYLLRYYPVPEQFYRVNGSRIHPLHRNGFR